MDSLRIPDRRRFCLAASFLAAASIGGAPSAWAASGDFTSETAAQFYDVRSPTGEVVFLRQRMTTSLGASAFNLFDQAAAPPGSLGPEWSFHSRLRYDADFATKGGETDKGNLAAYVPGLTQQNVDLMYAYIEGRRLLHGWVTGRVGRQYVIDSLGFWSFDGVHVRVVSPYYVAAEAYGGLEVRGGMPFSSARFEADGVWRGDRANLDPAAYPSFQPVALAPAFGASIESAGVSFMHGRLSYRRVENTGASTTTQFGSPAATYSSPRVSREQLAYSLEGTWGDKAGAKGALVYDLYRNDVTSLYASVDAHVTKRVTASVDFDYFRPSFDGDSIWNFFIGEPTSDIGIRSLIRVNDRLSLTARAHVRLFEVSMAAAQPNASPNIAGSAPSTIFPSNGISFDDGFDTQLRYRTGQGGGGFRGSAQLGSSGDRVGGELFADRTYDRAFGQLRGSVFQWDDKLRPDRSATSVGYVASLGYRFADRSKGSVEWEHEMNRLSGQRFRLVFWFTLAGGK